MIKYFCDKCGKEIGDFNMNEIFTVKVEPPEVRSWRDEGETGTYILCHAKPIVIYKDGIKTFPIPDACKSCSNHPSNGGSGICNCTLGTPQVKC